MDIIDRIWKLGDLIVDEVDEIDNENIDREKIKELVSLIEDEAYKIAVNVRSTVEKANEVKLEFEKLRSHIAAIKKDE